MIDTAPSLPRIGKETLVPAIVCAVISMLLARAGFFSFFFLVPMGLCAFIFGPAVGWIGSIFAIAGNVVISLAFPLHGAGLLNTALDMLYYIVFFLGFIWIITGNPPILSIPPVRTVFRFIAASAAGALIFLAVTFYSGGEKGFSALLRSQIEVISSSYIASSGADAAQRAFMETQLDPDRIMEMFFMVILRGGALVSALFLFFFSRQTTFLFARLFRRQGKSFGSDLIGFYVPRKAIWFLIVSLAVILLCRVTSLTFFEIAAWNVFVMCVIMFIAQGGGIVLFNLTRRVFGSRPMSIIMRLCCILLFLFLIFSPGINVVVIGILVLLGLAENWLPLRAQKQDMTAL